MEKNTIIILTITTIILPIVLIVLAILLEDIRFLPKRLKAISKCRKFAKCSLEYILLENEQIIIEFNYNRGDKRITCTDKTNLEKKITTKAVSSRYFLNLRETAFAKICERFNEKTDYNNIAELLKYYFDVSEKKAPKQKLTSEKVKKSNPKHPKSEPKPKETKNKTDKNRKPKTNNERIIDF